MLINYTVENNKLIISPVGRIDSTTSDEFNDVIVNNFKADNDGLIIDFKDVDFISSKGLRIIVSIYKVLNGRTMEIINANESVIDVFKVSGLLKVLDVK